MRIEYDGEMADREKLRPFLTEADQEYISPREIKQSFIPRKVRVISQIDGFEPFYVDVSKSGLYIARFAYNWSGIQGTYVDDMEKDFNEHGMETTRTATNALWVQKPTPFAFRMWATEGYRDDQSYGYYRYYICTAIIKGVKQRGAVETKSGLFRKRTVSVPVFEEIPLVKISGNIAFESPEPDIQPVLEILKERGYTPKIITSNS